MRNESLEFIKNVDHDYKGVTVGGRAGIQTPGSPTPNPKVLLVC